MKAYLKELEEKWSARSLDEEGPNLRIRKDISLSEHWLCSDTAQADLSLIKGRTDAYQQLKLPTTVFYHPQELHYF